MQLYGTQKEQKVYMQAVMQYKDALYKLNTLETELDNLRQQIVRPYEEFFYFQ